ncbi:MAG TPA: RNA polymerase factor sigma-54 [Candidatus Krumholzibacteria bacterium]|nr:RNA polymerase factor sigma-54 [Candidatus Krumholzibacteria bacterium]
MAPNIGMFQKMALKQQLVMTQRLQQALKLLQVPTLELEQILRQELQGNPLLEEVEPEEEVEAETALDRELSEMEGVERTRETEPEHENRDWGDSWDEGFRAANSTELGWDDEDDLERPQKYVPSGQEDLSDQLHLAVPDGLERRIGEYIIGCLNEDGMLACPVAEIAAYFEVDSATVEAVLRIVQTFDPPGVAARDLPECLLLQLEARGLEESDEAHVIRHHFEALKNRKFAEIAREMKIGTADVQEIATRIGELDPRPGLSLQTEGARVIVPDLEVVKVDEDGDEYAVYLNDANLPRLRVSQAYEGGSDHSEDEVKFIDEKKKHAEWVIKTIEQRRRTMIKVMEAIVREQNEFFEKGAIALRPLTLQQVASAIGMHESTVSRVTRQKYVQTPRGVFPLKFFFSAGLDSSDGGEVAAKAVKLMIKEIIEGENTARPLSDKKIVDMLQDRGLRIARRTVAKYREQMGILSARMRKQF